MESPYQPIAAPGEAIVALRKGAMGILNASRRELQTAQGIDSHKCYLRITGKQVGTPVQCKVEHPSRNADC